MQVSFISTTIFRPAWGLRVLLWPYPQKVNWLFLVSSLLLLVSLLYSPVVGFRCPRRPYPSRKSRNCPQVEARRPVSIGWPLLVKWIERCPTVHLGITLGHYSEGWITEKELVLCATRRWRRTRWHRKFSLWGRRLIMKWCQSTVIQFKNRF